jgi:predicted peptidase
MLAFVILNGQSPLSSAQTQIRSHATGPLSLSRRGLAQHTSPGLIQAAIQKSTVALAAWGFSLAILAWPSLLLGQTSNLSLTFTNQSDMPRVGKTIISPLSSQAAKRQAALAGRICLELGRTVFEASAFADVLVSKEPLRYRLFHPTHLTHTNKYPLVICLHGGGAIPSFDDLLKCASPVFAYGPARFTSRREQAQHPAFVLVPWSGPNGWDDRNCRLIIGLLHSLQHQLPIDPKRVYITGQSMGGFGTWRMIADRPELFAAAVPVCGGGDPASAPNAKPVAVWAFHGSKDGIVPVSETRKMVDALLAADGRLAYWEYEGETHASTAERAYCEPELLNWMFRQSKP